MEVQPGVFRSAVSTTEWEHDPEVGGEMHVLCATDGLEAGLSRYGADALDRPIVYTAPGRETVLILEGSATIELDGGGRLDLAAGDMASVPAGTRAVWRITSAPFKEFWVIGGSPADDAA
jgi:uncharacterized cupin superfamily protein